MRVLVDASTLIALGEIGELQLLTSLEGRLMILPSVRKEVTTEPASLNLDQFLEDIERFKTGERVEDVPASESEYESAKRILNESERNGDVQIIAVVLRFSELDEEIGVISDDRRVRTVAKNLGATVTGTIGIITRAVGKYNKTVEEGKDLVRRVDSHGLHMTGELREKAYELVEEAAEND